MQGHGRRARQLRGPPAPDAPPEGNPILVRRYECQHCWAILTVVPAETAPRRHYGATAIALALALFGSLGQTQAQVRAAVSSDTVVGVRAERRWHTLARWVDAVGERRLFAALPAMPVEQGRRAIAERAAMAIGAHAPPSVPEGALARRAFVGATQMP